MWNNAGNIPESLMIARLNKIKENSKDGKTLYAMSNGSNVLCADTGDMKKDYEKAGYWVCAIFEDGKKVES